MRAARLADAAATVAAATRATFARAVAFSPRRDRARAPRPSMSTLEHDTSRVAGAPAPTTSSSSRSSSRASTRRRTSSAASPRRCDALRRRTASPARSSSPTTPPRTAAPSSPPPPARASCTSRAAATAAPTSPASPPPAARYIVMARRRPDVRLRRDPALRRAARRRRRARHGRPDGQHPARARCRGCTATSATRCSPASSTSSSAPASATRTAACAALRRDVLPRLDLRTTGMEFASEMVIRAVEGEARHPRVPDRVPPARRRVASSRASATAGATCASCSSTARRTCSCCPGACMLALGALDRARSSLLADRRLRPRVGPAHDGRRRAADDRRHAGRRARPVRARLRHVLHGREGPVVRPHARRASGSSTACCSAA